MASFRFNKNTAAEFNLKPIDGKEYYADEDGKKWKQCYLWDNGWGPEFGFVKLPIPGFDKLWKLLTLSDVEDNQLGAAEWINEHYPEEMKQALRKLLDNEVKLNRNMTRRLSLLNLGINRSEILNKSPIEVVSDNAEWKKLQSDFERMSTASLWQRLFGK